MIPLRREVDAAAGNQGEVQFMVVTSSGAVYHSVRYATRRLADLESTAARTTRDKAIEQLLARTPGEAAATTSGGGQVAAGQPQAGLLSP
jgi:hypothetical protein